MTPRVSARRLAEIAITVQFLAPVRTLAEFYRLRAVRGATLGQADEPQRSALGPRLSEECGSRPSALGPRPLREGREDVPHAEGFLTTAPAEGREPRAESRR